MESKRVVSSQGSVVSALPRGMRLMPGLRMLVVAAVALAAGGVWAATPLAVWNGDFGGATTRNGVTFSANDNTVNADGSVTIGNSKGIVFTAPKEYAYITAVFTVSNVVETTEADRILVSFANGSTPRGGVYLTSGSVATGGINGTGKWSTTSADGNLGANDATAGTDDIRTFEAQTCSYQSSTPYGVHLYEVYSDGTAAAVRYGTEGNNDLKYSTSYNKITIGGFEANNATLSSMEGLVVLQVAIYASDSAFPLTAANLSNYTVPAAANVGTSLGISALNTALASSGNTFINFTADNVYLTADATPAANVILPYDSTVTLTDGALALSGSLPVKLPSSGVTSVTGSGVIVADDATSLTTVQGLTTSLTANTWTGTVWLKNQQILNLAPTTYGNSGSTLRLSGIYGYFGKAAYTAASSPALELEDDSYGYGLRFTDGYSYDSNSGWAYAQFPALKGSGKLITNTHTGNKGQLGLIMFQDWSEFTGSMALTNRTVWLGTSAAPASDNSALSVGTIYVESGKTFDIPTNWSNWYMTTGFTGAGTVKMTSPAQSQKSNFATNAKWTGTVELSAQTTSSSTAVYLAYMGNSGSKIVLKGLSGSSHWLSRRNSANTADDQSSHTVAAEVQLDGDITINNGSSEKTYTFNKVSGTGNINWTASLSKYMNLQIKDVSGYTGTIACSGNNTAYLGVPTTPEVGDLIAKFDSTNNKVSTGITVGGTVAKAAGELTTVNEVYGLYATARATIGETGYTTLAQAIENASEGATITLSSSATENALTIDKNLTIDLAEKTTDIPYISIAEGKTLTLKRANKSNQIGYFTGGGNLVVSGNNTFRWDSMSGTSTLASITQESSSGGISISGHGTINVSGDVSVAATLTFTPSSAEPAYITDGFTIKMTANSVNADTLNGAATIETVEGTTVGAGTFYGVVNGVLNASGNFTSQGANALKGKIIVADGKTFTIGNRLASMSNIRFHLDATDSSTYTLAAETSNLSEIKGGDNTYSLESGSTAAVLNSGDENHFGGQPYFQFDGSKYARGNKVSAKSYIAVTHPDSLGGYLARYSDQDRLGVDSNGWYARCYGNNRNDYIVQNGTTNRTATAGADTIISLPTRITASDNREDHLGTSYVGAIAEFVGFNSAISVEDRAACEMYLMDKWNLAAAANFRPFDSTAEVELGTGATLDLGGYTQTVASFTGAGTVQNGTLYTTSNVYTNNGALAIAAVDNMTVVLDAGATALTITGDAAGIKVVASESFAANPSDVTITATGLTGANTIDFSEVPSLFRFGVTDNQDGTWTIAKATTFEAATYTWSPAGTSTDWDSLANWKVGEQSVAVLPQSVDTVVFPDEGAPEGGWTVALTDDVIVDTVQANDALILSGALICAKTVTGEGVITLNGNTGFKTVSYNNDPQLTINNDLIINNTGNKFTSFGGSNYMNGGTVKVLGKVSGDGEIATTGARTYFEIGGDWSEFEGTITVMEASYDRNSTHITTSNGESKKARWNVLSGNNINFTPSGSTWKFGELTGYPQWTQAASYNSATLYIGCLNTDFALDGKYNPGSGKKGNHIIKEGTGTMTFTGSGVESYTVNDGKLVLADDDTLPATTLTMSGGTLAVTALVTVEDTPAVVDEQTGEETTPAVTHEEFLDPSAKLRSATGEAVKFTNNAEESHNWATALDNSNTALTKYGTGTLTLSAAPSAETFEISVEAGKVVVPNTATNTKPAKGTKCEEVGETLEYTKGPEIENGATDSVEGLADQAAADAVAATYNVTLTDAQVTQGLETSYYKVVATQVGETTTYNMSVVLDEAEVGVDFGEEGDTVEPVVFTGSAPTFQLKECVKKGLYYSVGTITDPTAVNPTMTVLAEQQATADGQEISLTPALNFGAGNVLYYKLSVSDTAQVTND